MVHPHNGILFSNTKEQNIDTFYNLDELQNMMLSERSQMQRAQYFTNQFI